MVSCYVLDYMVENPLMPEQQSLTGYLKLLNLVQISFDQDDHPIVSFFFLPSFLIDNL